MSKLTISYFLNDRTGLDLTPLKQFQYKENLLISESIRNLVKNDLNFDKQFNLSFIHKFNEGGHKIDFTFQNEIDDESEKSDLRTELIYPNYLRGLLEENNVEEDEEQLLFQLDYVNRDKDEVKNFRSLYFNEQNIAPSYYSYWGYDMLIFYARMLNAGKNQLRNSLNAIEYSQGYTLDGFDYTNGSNENQIVPIIKYQDGRFIEVMR